MKNYLIKISAALFLFSTFLVFGSIFGSVVEAATMVAVSFQNNGNASTRVDYDIWGTAGYLTSPGTNVAVGPYGSASVGYFDFYAFPPHNPYYVVWDPVKQEGPDPRDVNCRDPITYVGNTTYDPITDTDIWFVNVNFSCWVPIVNNTLNVQSNIGGVSISGSQGGTGGSTNYTITMASDINTTLTAPLTWNGWNFTGWSGCTSSGNQCFAQVSGGAAYTVTANYSPPVNNQLLVTSNISNVSISGSQGGTGGTTNYTVTMSSDINTTLTAPSSWGGYTFSSWSGCTSSGNQCFAAVSGGAVYTVTANYVSSGISVDLKMDGSDGPLTVAAGSAHTLTWTSANATSCTASGAWSGGYSTSGTHLVVVNSPSTYILTCTNSIGQSASDSVTANVPSVTVDLKMDGSDGPLTNLASGSSHTLSWTSANATSCTASGLWSGGVSLNGSQPVIVNSSGTYTITCSNAIGQTATDSVTITVLGAPTVDLKMDGLDGPLTVASGSSHTLSWTSANATSCTASGAWSGGKSLNGSESTTVNVAGTYTITCSNAIGQTAIDSVTVNVGIAPSPSPTPSPSPSPLPGPVIIFGTVFKDSNGDQRLDYTDANGNGVYDGGEETEPLFNAAGETYNIATNYVTGPYGCAGCPATPPPPAGIPQTLTLRPNSESTNPFGHWGLYGTAASRWDGVNDLVRDDSGSGIMVVATPDNSKYTELGFEDTSLAASTPINKVTFTWVGQIIGAGPFPGTELRVNSSVFDPFYTWGGIWTWNTRTQEYAAKPGGGAWTVADVNAMTVGMAARQSVDTHGTQITQVYATVEYMAPSSDVCPNIAGNQTAVPPGMFQSGEGNCFGVLLTKSGAHYTLSNSEGGNLPYGTYTVSITGTDSAGNPIELTEPGAGNSFTLRAGDTLACDVGLSVNAVCSSGTIKYLHFGLKSSVCETRMASLVTPLGGFPIWNNASAGSLSANDGAYAYAFENLNWTYAYSEYMRLTDFGFSIPAGRQIDGVEVSMDARSLPQFNGFVGSFVNSTAQLTSAGISIGNANSTFLFPDAPPDKYMPVGSETDLWGVALTPATVNAPDFGVDMRLNLNGKGGVYGYVDHVTAKICHSPAPAVPPDVSIEVDSHNGPIYAPNGLAVVTYKVTNNSTVTMPATSVSLWPDSLPSGSCPAAFSPTSLVQPVASLAPGASAYPTFSFNVGSIDDTAYAYVNYACNPVEGGWVDNLSNAFNYTINTPAWFEANDGDVGAHLDIIQSGTPATSSSDYLLASGTLTNVTTSGWKLAGYSAPAFPQVSTPVYEYLAGRFLQRAEENGNATCNQSTLDPNQFNYCSGPVTLTVGSAPAGNTVWFIGGDLTVEGNYEALGNDTIIFIVKGNITVNTSVDEADGIYVAGGAFTDVDAGIQGPQLIIDGAVYATGNVNLPRVLTPAPSNTTTPAEVINFRAKYIDALNKVLGSATITWQEVAP